MARRLPSCQELFSINHYSFWGGWGGQQSSLLLSMGNGWFCVFFKKKMAPEDSVSQLTCFLDWLVWIPGQEKHLHVCLPYNLPSSPCIPVGTSSPSAPPLPPLSPPPLSWGRWQPFLPPPLPSVPPPLLCSLRRQLGTPTRSVTSPRDSQALP